MDEVVAEIGLDDVAGDADVHAEDGGVEFGDHLTAAEFAEIAALGRRRAVGVFLGQFAEIGTAVDLGLMVPEFDTAVFDMETGAVVQYDGPSQVPFRLG